MAKKEAIMEVVIVPQELKYVFSNPKPKDVRKFTFRKGKSKAVKAEGVFPKGWGLKSDLEVTILRYRGWKGRKRYEARIPNFDGADGHAKTAKGAIKDMAAAMTEYSEGLEAHSRRAGVSSEINPDRELLRAKLKRPAKKVKGAKLETMTHM